MPCIQLSLSLVSAIWFGYCPILCLNRKEILPNFLDQMKETRLRDSSRKPLSKPMVRPASQKDKLYRPAQIVTSIILRYGDIL